MMHHMDRPKDIDLMRQPVIPVPYQIGKQKKRNPGYDTGLNIKYPKMIMNVIEHKKE